MIDKHYTPAAVAAAMIDAASSNEPSRIADFAAGRGQLLSPASERWPRAEIIANDLDASAIRHLRRHHMNWVTLRSDFLDPKTRERVREQCSTAVDLILLNPPFSCRGGRVHQVTFGGLSLKCSTAIAFVLAALPFLSPNGELIAVLPYGSLRSEKDRDAWSVIRTKLDVEIIADFDRSTFPGCAVRTAIIRVRFRAESGLRAVDGNEYGELPNMTIIRGTLQVHRAILRGRQSKTFLPFIHSTTLRENLIVYQHWTRSDFSVVTGPAVLLPRVGLPDHRKVATLNARTSVVLSDCVFAVGCDSDDAAATLKAVIVRNWLVVKNAYSGTCAPYLTIAGLRTALLSFSQESRETRKRLQQTPNRNRTRWAAPR